ncbi:CcoQ/FixQ family Cbb3-type cytochrome c oxidase assembly chaperone [Haoranjiania flava]|uniref:CcoQ/FixQ family Cbb3-type cytochrome c oxidase assembly chaperone n=1 Tax=Haoranjiania flava TaxID=1856322 RepID=A0AAE3IM30_9BACT|nr:CcoQ/FixQ family Cbb3-type cytochrome c oxidase assembly chaperone [Haoranjiania flava]MCU7694054.1 CcoQ/FixQ family Cbb3-type cytochrome c oxidase assembly chaperone [Haoranjiania flava]
MKFTYYLEKIHGVSIYPIISLAVFVLFFLIVLVWTYKSDSRTIEYIENLPLEEEDMPVGSENR